MNEEVKEIKGPGEVAVDPAASTLGEAPKGSDATIGVGASSEPRGEGAGGAGSSPDGSAPSPKDPEAPKGQWPKSAIDEVTKARARFRDSQDRVAKLTARLQEFEARGAGATPPINPQTGQAFTPEQIEAMVQERASLLANQQAFDARCNEAASRGREKFGDDWQPRLNDLSRLVDRNDQRSTQAYNLFLEAALETGQAEAIIHKLGSDLNEGARILALPPVKMALEVGKLGAGIGNPVSDLGPSKLPRPIRPVGSSSPSTAARPDDPERGAEIPMKDWVKARDAQVLERRRGH